jgi:pimeloyl-ACP methyl ester carboxylesterase
MGLAPRTEFVRRGDAHLAYQVFGEGPASVLMMGGTATHQEAMWQWPLLVRLLERLAVMARVAQYDSRGTGMSDALPAGGYSIEESAADALAVLDAAGFSRAVLWGEASGGAVAIWLAVHYPERVTGLVLDNAWAWTRARPGNEIGYSDAEIAEGRRYFGSIWGTGATIDLFGGRYAADERVREECARFERMCATPSSFIARFDVTTQFDVRDLLSAVAVPTLVVHWTRHTTVPVSHARYLAKHIAAARLIEVDAEPIVQLDNPELRGDISEFLTGTREHAHIERSLVVVLFTDIAGSTDQIAATGDETWLRTLGEFRGLVRKILDRYSGREVNTRGDDFFAVVSTPSVAVEIAQTIRSEVASLGLSVRTGIHLGEVERQGDDYAGLTVHVGARIAALAQPNEILISQAVRDALLGSALEWSDRGAQHLKGVPNEWQIFAIEPQPDNM